MYVTEKFTCFYNEIRDILNDKTSFQALKTEEIMQVMQIAATLTLAHNVEMVKEEIFNLPIRNN